MGQAASMEAAQRLVARDYAGRLVLSHGLYHSPYPAGSYVLCEVDLLGAVPAKPRSDVGTEVVAQIIVLNDGRSESVNKRDEMNPSEVEERRGTHELPNGEVPGPLTKSERTGAIEAEVQIAKEPSFADWGRTNEPVPRAEQLTQEVMSKLAPGVSIAPVSFDRLLNDIRKFNAENLWASSMANEEPASVPYIAPRNLTDERSKSKEVSVIGVVKHPNLVPVLGAYKGEGVLYLVFPRVPFSLETIVHFSPAALVTDDHIRLLLFGMMAGLSHCHDQGIYHGNLRPWNVLVLNSTWCWLAGFGDTVRNSQVSNRADESRTASSCDLYVEDKNSQVACNRDRVGDLRGMSCTERSNLQASSPVDGSLSDYKGSNLLAEARFSHTKDWTGVFKRWWAGEVSNYDYLLLLNKLAGRRWGDECFHTVMPWVIDFSVKPDTSSSKGWRDLSKSKWRLAKGDEQLDFTFLNAEIPHHVSDECLSELAVCIYKARRLPLLLLRRIVRSVYEPNEYPANMQRLYQWTPDECIPEFYSDPDVFRSIHAGMSDLAIPLWSQSAVDLISLHRAALESYRVSQQLHHWIDITFGYKLSGQAAIDAKNVTLSSDPTVPRGNGRRQLFSIPHPRRRERRRVHLPSKSKLLTCIEKPGLSMTTKSAVKNRLHISDDDALGEISSSVVAGAILIEGGILERASNHLKQVAPLEELVECNFFAEKARYLSPCYVPRSVEARNSRMLSKARSTCSVNNLLQTSTLGLPNEDECVLRECSLLYKVHSQVSTDFEDSLRMADDLRDIRSEDNGSLDHLVWWEALKQQQGTSCSVAEGEDVFATACIIAEIYLRKPLFDPVSMATYEVSGTLPKSLNHLPSHVLLLIKPALNPDFLQRPNIGMLLKSPFFSTRIRSVYSFLATLRSLRSRHEGLQFLVKMAKLNTFQKLGSVATEMVTPSCLSLLTPFSTSLDPAEVVCLLKELLRALRPLAALNIVLPVISHFLQNRDLPAVQIALVHPAFLGDVHRILGTTAFISHLYPLVLDNLRRSPHGHLEKATVAALVSICQDLGLPITVNQTLTPIMLSFGRDVSASGMDAVLAIGEQLGERAVVKHILPAARFILSMGLQLLSESRVLPSQSIRLLAMVDAMAVLDRIVVRIPTPTILSELLQDPNNVYVQIVLQPKLTQNLRQSAAKALLLVCEQVGSEITAGLVLPQLKSLFDEVATAYEHSRGIPVSDRERMRNCVPTVSSSSHEVAMSEPDLLNANAEDTSTSSEPVAIVYILYPGFASLLGIEKLRQCLNTWLLLEQSLLKHFHWKWQGSNSERRKSTGSFTPKLDSGYDLNPANLLLDGVSWSIPLSQSRKWKASVNISEFSTESSSDSPKCREASSDEPWSWVPALVDSFGSAEAFARGWSGLAKDEQPWELSSVILHSIRVHQSGGMRTAAVMEDENTVFTAGGSGCDSVVRQWKLATSECCMEYGGHQEAVADICLLPGNRVASCDGTLHLWSPQTGEQLAVFDESSSTASTTITSLLSTTFETGRVSVRKSDNGTTSVGGLSGSPAGGHVYTCLHSMEAEGRLVTGTVNGSLRFFDMVEGRRLFLWRCNLGESYVSSYVSALSSCGQQSSNNLSSRYVLPSAWVAAGFSSGQCRLLDYRSGRVVMNWRAHDASVTKLGVLDSYYLVSSSIDKTLRLWDLRRNVPSKLQTFSGHSSGVVSFALRGTNMLSAAGNKIGLSSLCKTPQSGQDQQLIRPQRLYTAHQGSRSFSTICSISVLPFSRLFLVATEDGFLKVCT